MTVMRNLLTVIKTKKSQTIDHLIMTREGQGQDRDQETQAAVGEVSEV